MNGQHFRDGDEPTALVHPADAAESAVNDGDLIDIVSAAGVCGCEPSSPTRSHAVRCRCRTVGAPPMSTS